MTQGLFRREAIVARQTEWLGSIRLQPPRAGWYFFGTGLFAVAIISVLLVAGHYTRHEHVSGSLVPSGGLLNVVPVSPGVVTKILVQEGSRVRAGQPLVEITSEQDSSSLGSTHAAITNELQFKRERLQADLNSQQNLAELQKEDLRSRLTMLHEQIAQMDQRIVLQKQLAEDALRLYKQWDGLGDSGVVSKLQILQQHDTVLQDEVQTKELVGMAFQLREQAQQLKGQLDQLPTSASSKRNDTERQLADISQSLSQNAAERAVYLVASADGTIENLLVHTGQAVSAQQSLMTVLPAGSKLIAEVWVPTTAIGFIHAGETVVMRYQAFPYQKFGQHLGQISGVSRSAISPAELSRMLGQDIKDARYRVQVALDGQSVRAYGHSEMLRPGMTLEADVLLDRRRLIEWVAEPLYGFKRNFDHTANGTGVAP